MTALDQVRKLRLLLATIGIAALLTACPNTGGTGTNQAPMAAAGADRMVTVGEVVMLDGSASADPDGDALSFSWAFESKPAESTATLQDAEQEQASFTPDVQGEYVITLSVSDGDASDTDAVTFTANPAGVSRLEGDPDSLAADAVFDLHVPLILDEALVEFDESLGARVLRTEIDIEFVPDATVGQVNDVLANLDGKIVSMVQNEPTVLVEIPDPGSIAALDELIAELEARPAVGSVEKSELLEVPEPIDPPESESISTEDLPPSLSSVARQDHNLAIRGHAAWNARNAIPALGNRPWFLIGDFFGDGQPANGYDIQSTAGDYGIGSANRHGYHVLGITTGDYGAGASTAQRSDVTGTFPDQLQVRAVDVTAGNNSVTRTRNRLVQRMNTIVAGNANATIVVNTSMGYASPNSIGRTRRNNMARRYINMIRNNNLENRVVHVTAAGNAGGTATNPTTWPAANSSLYAYAALGDVNSIIGTNVDNLNNVLVIENRVNTFAGTLQRPVPGCANGSSIMGGQLSGIGTQVWSFGRQLLDATGNVVGSDSQGASSIGGTSMSTPQVAGLAALVWSLDTSLNAPAVVNLLRNTARNDYNATAVGNNAASPWGCNATAPAPVVDALNAVLAAGGNAVPRAILDVADAGGNPGSNGAFDEQDVSLFTSTYAASPALDYSRFDLSGDGVTDGAVSSTATERFDLDGDGTLGSVTASYEGYSVTLDETAVTDLDVLCYYAFGSVYSGSTFDRNRDLGQPCGIVDVTILDPSHGDSFAEGEEIGFLVDVDIEGTHEGDVILYSRGTEQDRVANYSYLDNYDISTLETYEVCPGDPTATVAFADDVSGLRASATVTLTITANSLSVGIGGPNPRWVRVKTSGGDPFIDDIDLSGKARVPTCEDPFSSRIDQSGLEWYTTAGSSTTTHGTGPNLTLTDTFLSDGSGGFQSRDIRLSVTYDFDTDTDVTTISPCSSSIGLDPGESKVSGYPECPLGAVMGDLAGQLERTFGTTDPNDIERMVGIIINGIPEYEAVLENLEHQPCDPTHCDPFPPTFPQSAAALSESFYGDRGGEISTYLDRLFGTLGAPTLGDFETQLDTLLRDVGADTSLSDANRRLFATATSIALAHVDFFSPESVGGENGWRNFGFAGDPDTLVDRANVLAPARASVEGYLTAVVETNAREDVSTELHKNAGGYAGSLGALEEAIRVKEVGGF